MGDDLGEEVLQCAREVSVHTFDWNHAAFKVKACNEGGGTESDVLSVKLWTLTDKAPAFACFDGRLATAAEQIGLDVLRP
ncbi:MAG: hypothetical protein IPJ88_02645 [Myxococcales bacterium]|nr:MAG: hypothetical protein IPJ88_02645 [Myxococcales bacterium]